MAVQIILPDGNELSFEKEPTGLEVAEAIGPRLAKAVVGLKMNGAKEVLDIRTTIPTGTKIELVTLKNEESLEVVRHSAAHIMAQAVQEIWPEVKVTIGPVIEDGFYYDFDAPFTFTEDDLEKIDKKVAEIIKRDIEIRRENWNTNEAIAKFKDLGENFKVEIIEDLGTDEVGVYWQGDQWYDLCRGPHVQRTSQVGAVKTLSVAGAYWRGDETKTQLQRIYATAFNDKKALKKHLMLIEEAKKRDHRKVGKALGLFNFHPNSPGGPFFTGKGTVVYNALKTFLRELYDKYGYEEVITPQIFDVDLYHQSGHYDNYRDNMYFTKIDERDFSVKPMNCPGHCLMYSFEKRSYRDLPFRVADFGRLHRYERSGALHGLSRVRTFAQDDGHIFCTMDQLQSEIEGYMKFLEEVYEALGCNEYKIYLSTRPEKRMGSDEVWDKSEKALEEALNKLNLEYEINEGDGAFYGPKLDIMFVDALKRPWQLGTIQADFNMPENFKLSYIGADNTEHQPVMLHRAILGSFERFIGVYLEHCEGKLPLWLSPVQIKVLNVTDRSNEFCHELLKMGKTVGLRCEFDDRSEKLNYKIREAQLQKIPYMVIVGDKEVEQKVISVRTRTGKVINGLDPKAFFDQTLSEIKSRQIALRET